jgi:malonate-semialdehyde dehydrogenase (acetylating)/methylmalonate-semialdehyde dehydrogenase
MEDADMQTTAEAIVGAAYGSAGERCMAISTVVMVGETVPAKLLSHLMPLIQAIKVGQGTLMDTDMGPIISQQHKENILKAIEKGVQEGATLLIDGRNFQHPSLSQGFFLGPSLFDGVETHMSLYQNEIFGPVLLLMRVRNLEEALLLLKRNPYGNGATIFTHNPFLAREFSLKAEVGMVGVNVPIPLPITTHPFGGWKASFFGDIAMHGEESIRFYTQKKTITTQWSAHFQGEKHSFHLPFTEE